MVARIMALNTVFFILFAIRRARGVRAMREWTAIKVQGLLILANSLILFQEHIQGLIRRIT